MLLVLCSFREATLSRQFENRSLDTETQKNLACLVLGRVVRLGLLVLLALLLGGDTGPKFGAKTQRFYSQREQPGEQKAHTAPPMRV